MSPAADEMRKSAENTEKPKFINRTDCLRRHTTSHGEVKSFAEGPDWLLQDVVLLGVFLCAVLSWSSPGQERVSHLN